MPREAHQAVAFDSLKKRIPMCVASKSVGANALIFT
jgi:hypothetical protein